jgi:hypothetical protein
MVSALSTRVPSMSKTTNPLAIILPQLALQVWQSALSVGPGKDPFRATVPFKDRSVSWGFQDLQKYLFWGPE